MARTLTKQINLEELQCQYNELIKKAEKLGDLYTLTTFQFLHKADVIGKKLYGNIFSYERLAYDFHMSVKQVERILSLKKANKKTILLIKEGKITVTKTSLILYCYNPEKQDEYIERVINENIKTYKITEVFKTYNSSGQRRFLKQLDSIRKGFSSKKLAYRSLVRLIDGLNDYLEQYEGRVSPQRSKEIKNLVEEAKSKLITYSKKLIIFKEKIPKRKRINIDSFKVRKFFIDGYSPEKIAITLQYPLKSVKLSIRNMNLKKKDTEKKELMEEYSKLRRRVHMVRDIYTVNMFKILEEAHHIGRDLKGHKFNYHDLAEDFDISYATVNRIVKLRYASEKTWGYIKKGKISPYKLTFVFASNGNGNNSLYFQEDIVKQIVEKGLSIEDIKRIVKFETIEEILNYDPLGYEYKDIPFIGLKNRLILLRSFCMFVSPESLPNTRVESAERLLEVTNSKINKFLDAFKIMEVKK